jgi:hypothetical protein
VHYEHYISFSFQSYNLQLNLRQLMIMASNHDTDGDPPATRNLSSLGAVGVHPYLQQPVWSEISTLITSYLRARGIICSVAPLLSDQGAEATILIRTLPNKVVNTTYLGQEIQCYMFSQGYKSSTKIIVHSEGRIIRTAPRAAAPSPLAPLPKLTFISPSSRVPSRLGTTPLSASPLSAPPLFAEAFSADITSGLSAGNITSGATPENIALGLTTENITSGLAPAGSKPALEVAKVAESAPSSSQSQFGNMRVPTKPANDSKCRPVVPPLSNKI